MRTPNIFLGLAISFAGALAAPNPAAAQERGTYEQQMACTPDVMRLCSDQIPDRDRIVACLRQNTPLLGSACRAVFDSSASAQQPYPRAGQQLPPRARGPQQPMQAQPAPPPRPYYNNDDDED